MEEPVAEAAAADQEVETKPLPVDDPDMPQRPSSEGAETTLDQRVETQPLPVADPDVSLRSSGEAVEIPSLTDGVETQPLPVADPDMPWIANSEAAEIPPLIGVEPPPVLMPELITPLRSSSEALEFLSLIGPEELQLCVFAESLVTVSDTGRELGEFIVSVQPAHYEEDGKEEVECYLVHAASQGAIDDIPCGTSIIAYVSKKLETLEQHYHEYLKLEGHTLDKKTHLMKQGDKLVLNKIITQGENVEKQTSSYDWGSLEGFVSEASNLLIMRVLAKRRVIPDNMVFLAFDMESHLCTSTYSELGVQTHAIGKETVEMFGIERSIRSEEDIPISWQCFFLSDGHLSSRVQVGSPVTMKLLVMPILVEKDEMDPKPVFGKKDLEWEEDVQLYSRFLDRKEELRADHATYIRRHPEVQILMVDFMQFLLLRKPDDIVPFAAEFFASFGSARPPANTFRTSHEPSPFRKPCQ